MHNPVLGILVCLIAVAGGVAMIRYRVPLARYFRRRQEEQGGRIIWATWPVMGLIVGLGWIAIGLVGIAEAVSLLVH